MAYIFTYDTPKGASLQDLSCDGKYLTIGLIVFKLWAKNGFWEHFHGFSWGIAQGFWWKIWYLRFLLNSVHKGSLGCWFQIQCQISYPIKCTAWNYPILTQNQGVFPILTSSYNIWLFCREFIVLVIGWEAGGPFKWPSMVRGPIKG